MPVTPPELGAVPTPKTSTLCIVVYRVLLTEPYSCGLSIGHHADNVNPTKPTGKAPYSSGLYAKASVFSDVKLMGIVPLSCAR